MFKEIINKVVKLFWSLSVTIIYHQACYYEVKFKFKFKTRRSNALSEALKLPK